MRDRRKKPRKTAEIKNMMVLLSAGILVLSVFSVLLSRPGEVEPATGLALLLAAVLLEGWTVYLPSFGVYSAAPAVYIAAAAYPGLGPWVALVITFIGVAFRFGLFSGERPYLWFESLMSVFPSVSAIFTVTLVAYASPASSPLVQGIAGVVAQLLALLYMPTKALYAELPRDDYIVWYGVIMDLRPLWLGPGLCSLVLLALLPKIGYLLLLLPLLLGSSKAAKFATFSSKAREGERTKKELAKSHASLKEAKTQITRAMGSLQDAGERQKMLEGFATHLASDPTPEDVAEALLGTLKGLFKCRSYAVFLSQNGSRETLLPFKFDSPAGETLENSEMLKAREPLVDKTFGGARPMKLGPDTAHRRIFQGEEQAWAFPMGGSGVIYLGRQRQPFTKEEVTRVRWIAEKAHLAIQASRRSQARAQALVEQSTARYHLQERVDLLALLMEGSRQLASTLLAEELEAAVREFLRRAVPHDLGLLRYGGRRRVWTPQGPAEPPVSQAEAAVTERILEYGVPLIIDDFRKSKLESPRPGIQSLLAVPMRTDTGVFGVLMLGAEPADNFTREHQDLLSAIAYSAGVAFSNSKNYQEVVEARKQLEASQEQLIQTSKMMAVGQLAAGVSHELNNPLGAIALSISSAQDQLERGSIPKAMKRLKRALKTMERARHIINKLLFYSRKSDQDERIEINEVVRQTVDFVDHHVEQMSFSLETLCYPEELYLKGRDKDLQQVLVNLVMNAMEAGLDLPPERRKIILKVEGPRDGYLLVTVRDFGPGIRPEVLSRIFEPFYTTKDVGEGTGLGLSISQKVLERHRGSLSVESQPGRGAVFTLKIPELKEEVVAGG